MKEETVTTAPKPCRLKTWVDTKYQLQEDFGKMLSQLFCNEITEAQAITQQIKITSSVLQGIRKYKRGERLERLAKAV